MSLISSQFGNDPSPGIPVSQIGSFFNQDFQQIYPIFRSVVDVEAIPILDEVSTSLTYVGWAVLGTATSSPKWKIIRITKSGTITLTEYADGNMNYDNVWDNRAALTYSR